MYELYYLDEVLSVWNVIFVIISKVKCEGEWKNIIIISLCKDFIVESLKRGWI